MRVLAIATPARRIGAQALALCLAGLLVAAAPAHAAAAHVGTAIPAGILGNVFSSVGQAVLGAFSWTFGLASKFFLVTLGALVKLLIPRSWAQRGVQVMGWVVQIPNYAGTIGTPQGQEYGFRGINELRDLFTWLGVAIGPLTLTFATGRAIASEREHPAAPITRMVAVAIVLISYPYWWAQGSAVIDQVTHTILSLPAVSDGIHKLMLYAVDGVALGGWELIDLGLMLAIALALLALIFLKVVIILLGALLYAIGPLMLGLVPLASGAAIARAWAAAATTLIALPVLWASVFAVGALLIDDAGTAGPLLAGNTTIGHLIGGLLLAVAGLAALWACLRVAKEAAGLLRLQLGGMLAGLHALRGGPSTTGTAVPATGTAARSVREFSERVSRTASGAGQAIAQTGPRAARAGGLAATVGRRGLVGSAALAGAAGARQLAAYTGGPRAGVVAMQIARAGRSYTPSPGTASAPAPPSAATRQPTATGSGASTTAIATAKTPPTGQPASPANAPSAHPAGPPAPSGSAPRPVPSPAPVSRGASSSPGQGSRGGAAGRNPGRPGGGVAPRAPVQPPRALPPGRSGRAQRSKR